MPSSFPVDPDHNPPSILSPPIFLLRDVSVPPASYSPTPENTLTQPPWLASARKGALDPTGILGGFISENTCAYWGSVPGGEKLIAMVRSYIELQTMPPLKNVRIVSCHTFCNQLILHPASSATLNNISTTRSVGLVEEQETFSGPSTCYH